MALPVLLLTPDDHLYHHWDALAPHGWAPARGNSLADLEPWGRRGVLVLLDARVLMKALAQPAGLPAIPSGLQVVVASPNPNDPEAQRAMVAGAAGYVHAFMPVQGLNQVLLHVMQGQIWLGQNMLSRMLSQISHVRPETDQDWARDLTVRERDVARYVAQGHSNQSIADSLGITERTVRAHLSAIFEKLGVTDRLALALRVHGVVQLDSQAQVQEK